MRQALEYDVTAPAMARRAAEAFLDQSTGQLTGQPTGQSAISAANRRKLVLVVSELVTNAVQHGGPPIELWLTQNGDRVSVEVRDSGPLPDLAALSASHALSNATTGTSPGPPTGTGDPSLGGRGLMIVDQLADHWGARAHDGGKTIWCDVGIS